MTWLLYGAYGYTGELIAREAARRGLRPILAGRNAVKVQTLADELHLDFRAFSLSDHEGIVKQLRDCNAVLNCAGPFSKTARPMMEACLSAGSHYLDVTGEINVIETAAALDERAKEAGVVLMPAVGFDVVPTDCLASMLVERMPDATHLRLALAALTNVSPGTGKTMAEMLPAGGRVREGGKITHVPLAHKSRSIAFADRRRQAVTMPWGDVASAYHSTGIENIEVYFALPKWQIKWLRRLRWLLPMMGLSPLQALWKSAIGKLRRGPEPAQRSSGSAQLWGEVTNDKADSLAITMTTPDGYALTVETALAAVERIKENKASDLSETQPNRNTSGDLFHAGFQTPSRALGSDFILEFDVEMHWCDGD